MSLLYLHRQGKGTYWKHGLHDFAHNASKEETNYSGEDETRMTPKPYSTSFSRVGIASACAPVEPKARDLLLYVEYKVKHTGGDA
jgi:hypothetical protein